MSQNFKRDITFLNQGIIPMEPSGLKVEKLDYKGDPETPDANLNDNDVQELCNALQQNDEFKGPLDLSNNDLSNLSALYLQQAISRPGSKNITKLNVSKNPRFSEKAGVFIGDALIENQDHPVEKLNFKNCDLGENGVIRIMEACNKNHNISKVSLGYVSDKSLAILAQTLRHNAKLEKLKFQEHKTLQWSTQSKEMFCDSLRTHHLLKKVKFEPADKTAEHEGHKLFKKEIEFLVSKIKRCHKQYEELEERREECSSDAMFKNLLKQIEDKEEHEKMPVRKFFNNTFGTLLNDAIFALMKKQNKSKSNQILTMQGSIRFVAQYLQDHLPDNEALADEDEDEVDGETDEV